MSGDEEVEAAENDEAQLLLDELIAQIAGHAPDVAVAALCGALISAVLQYDEQARAEWQIVNFANVAREAVRDHWHLLVAARAGGAN
ncbi:MAG TPA: hypothetical protein VL133_11345 [Devosia sp.]|nr:hypothetical protein [Devosia sp.]